MGLIIDNFAGGGGASTGIEKALGRYIDIAINHDPAAILMHKTNHPNTKHYCENIWEIDPLEATKGQEVDLAWFSPDCKHFSKAKGSKPKDKNIRGLAWAAVKWAKAVKPKVIMLENVEEFKTWGPLDNEGKIIKERAGETFEKFINTLKKLGYEVKYKELIACDYGAPTSRKRFFLIARCDGKKIVFPEATHGPGKKKYKTAGEIIDWSIPCNSIFGRKKPLSENTMKRILRGLEKFVFNNPEPYIVRIGQTGFGGDRLVYPLDRPLTTITTKQEHLLIVPFIQKYFGGYYKGAGSDLKNPLPTITTVDHNSLVAAFISEYYGCSIGSDLNKPLHTITSRDKFALIEIHGKKYQIIDIKMRMLQPRELFNAQGFPENYIIDHDYIGNKYPKNQQVARCGNSVSPVLAEALVKANFN